MRLTRTLAALLMALGLSTAPTWANECDPEVEAAIMEAAQMGYDQMIEDIEGSILEPAAIKVISCLNNVMNTGISITGRFGLPSLADIFNALADRICDEMDNLFDKVTEDMNARFSNEFMDLQIGVNQGQGSLFEINTTGITSPLDGSRIRELEDRIDTSVGTPPQIDVDVVRQLFDD